MDETSEMTAADVLIGTLLCRRTAYVLDIFLANQREIQQAMGIGNSINDDLERYPKAVSTHSHWEVR